MREYEIGEFGYFMGITCIWAYAILMVVSFFYTIYSVIKFLLEKI